MTPNQLRLIAQGDERAFHEFYNQHTKHLKRLLCKRFRVEAYIEDIMQETFIKIWRNRIHICQVSNLQGWVYRIATRVCIDYLSRELRFREKNDFFSPNQFSWSTDEHTSFLEVKNTINKTLEKLSKQKSNIYRLNREFDMKPAQIARWVGAPVGTIKNQLSATLSEIRKSLKAAGYYMQVRSLSSKK